MLLGFFFGFLRLLQAGSVPVTPVPELIYNTIRVKQDLVGLAKASVIIRHLVKKPTSSGYPGCSGVIIKKLPNNVYLGVSAGHCGFDYLDREITQVTVIIPDLAGQFPGEILLRGDLAEGRDLLLFSFSLGEGDSVEPVPIDMGGLYAGGDDILMIGYPKSSGPSVVRGGIIVSRMSGPCRIEAKMSCVGLILLNLTSAHGASGSGIFYNNRLIGILTASDGDFTFAVPIHWLKF